MLLIVLRASGRSRYRLKLFSISRHRPEFLSVPNLSSLGNYPKAASQPGDFGASREPRGGSVGCAPPPARRHPELLGQFSPKLGPSHAPSSQPAPPSELRWESSSRFVFAGAALRKILRGSSWKFQPLRAPIAGVFGPN